MILRRLAIPYLIAFLTACSGRDGSVVEFEYEKFTLDNGLEVILHRDTSDPVVAVTTVVHAGSHRERPGRTGFAHFFEHMAFNDSENVPRGWNRKAIPEWGGLRNGGTWSDGTIYYEVVPKDAFDKILWIASDRLGYMINTVTQAALDREKQVVKNEKRQRVDNVAYGYTEEVIRTALYPEDHPYSWTVIGSLPDLQAATLDDLREFYDRYYGAGNVTVAIAGDIEIEETRKKVERWFGEIRKGPEVEPLAAMPVTLDASRYLYFEDNFATLPELRLTFPTVESYHADETALDVLGGILGGSKNAALYRRVVNEAALAPNVSSYNNSMELAGEFVIRIRAKAGVDLDDVMAAVEAAMADFEKNGVDPKDLQRIKAEQEMRLYERMSTVLGKSSQLAIDNELAKDPAYAIKAAEKLRTVTAADVIRVYSTYIRDKPAVITSFVPKDEAELAVEGSGLATVWIEEIRETSANEQVGQGEEAEYEKTPSRHDRSEPPFGKLPLFKMPEVWTAEVERGLTVYGIENHETPLIAFEITLDGGRWAELQEDNGSMALLAGLMNEGSADRTPAEMEQAMGLLGSSVHVSLSSEEMRISGTSLARNFKPTLDLVNEILTGPRLMQDDFDRVKSAQMTAIRGREADPGAIASLAFNKQLYGDLYPLGLPSDGTLETVEPMTLDDIKAAYNDELFGSTMRVHIVGDIEKAAALDALGVIADGYERRFRQYWAFAVPPQTKGGNVYFIDVPGSRQSVLNIGKVTVGYDDDDYNRIVFTNEKLGGDISGDLAQTLRIEKGYTYGAYSWIGQGRAPQPFKISTSVRANATGPSLEIIRDLVTNHGPDFDEAAVELTKNKLIKENTRAFESLDAKLGLLRNIGKFNKPPDYVERDQAELIAMTVEVFRNTAKKHLSETDMIYVIVGDKATQFKVVEKFADGDVIELDIYGNPLAGTESEAGE
ncbi:MAG: insulinase family protein [Hyphomonadaceae bacterium]|nr:insulinase family protein [Hyphomonadaceae bacterium]MBC6413032.1 insulinase family protein [Hyphomonadaceae bacterium]